MTAWRYTEAKERDERYRARIKCDWGTAEDDRCELLALVERLAVVVREYRDNCERCGGTCERADVALREIETEGEPDVR